MAEIDWPGSCHCKAVAFRYSTAIAPSRWSVRACQCRFCRMHDALSTSDPDGRLAFFCHDAVSLERYRFALKTADFLLCRNCGVYVGAVIEAGNSRYGIINTRALSEAPPDMAEVAAIHYDDEDTDGRIDRRKERWTPVTEVPF